jgi:Predicted membrane protein (DUF2142)
MSAPQRLVLFLGGALGVLMVLAAPGWFGGADEGTHVMRSLALAHGQVFPSRIDGALISAVPRAQSESVGAVIRNAATHDAPNSTALIGSLLDTRPNWEDTVEFDTGATMASSPVAYAPSAISMAIPNALGAPTIVTLWFGRLGDLVVYLGLALLALQLAGGFRWTLALAALFPMNLAMAASVSPDAVTIGALLLVLALWTRLWRATGPDRVVDGVPIETLRRTALHIGAAGLLLALAKPPYFAVLAAFPALLLVRRRDVRVRVAAIASTAALAVGVLASMFSTSNDYRSAGAGMFAELRFQPDVQIRRITDAPVAFLWRCVSRWFEAVPDSVQRWTRQLGFWRSSLPAAVAWLIVVVFIGAAITLDAEDLLGLRRFCRAIFALGTAGVLLALMASSYIYFDDTLDGVHMTEQIARYALPMFAMAIMGWAPRRPLRGRVRELVATDRWRVGAIAMSASAAVVCVLAVIVEWWWPGVAGRFTGYG